MSSFVLSTVGTSLLTNAAADPALKPLIFKHANASDWSAMPEADRPALRAHIDAVDARLGTADPKEAARMSAELNGVLTWAAESASPADQHVLVASATVLGRATADLATRWLSRHGYAATTHNAAELQTGDSAAFRRAMSALLSWVGEQVNFYREGGYKVTFNLCGGFKGPNGFLHSVGALYADEVVYLFEGTSTLLRVPRLPVAIDHDQLTMSLPTWRRHKVGLPVAAGEVNPLILEELDGELYPSQFAEVIMADVERRAYGAALQPSPHPRLRWSASFEAQVSRLPERRRRQINERVDDLARHIEDRNYNPGRLDVKALRAEGQRRRAPSTLECDAWNDEDGKRIFLHKEGVGSLEHWVLDSLNTGLH
jgi:putative CRISPR-associated protein (TIGR02619 family)